jgi:hypothetical protein
MNCTPGAARAGAHVAATLAAVACVGATLAAATPAAPGGEAFAAHPELAELEASCQKGDAVSCNDLGVIAIHGYGDGVDANAAHRAFQRSCQRGSADGCGNLGALYESGAGVGVDPEPMSARLFDARGERTLLPWRAVRVESSALEPLEQRALELTFALPAGLLGPLLAEVSLTFQTFPVRLLQELQLDPDLAVSVVLASRTARIDVRDCAVSSAAPSGARRSLPPRCARCYAPPAP